jgi:hypothetical protein
MTSTITFSDDLRVAHNSRRGTFLIVVVAMISLLLALIIGLTVKVQASMQQASQIRKFTQATLLAQVVHTRWPKLKNFPNGGTNVTVFFSLYDISFSHPILPTSSLAGPAATSPTPLPSTVSPFQTEDPPVMLGYFISDWRDVQVDQKPGICLGGNKTSGYNAYAGASSSLKNVGFAYDVPLSFPVDGSLLNYYNSFYGVNVTSISHLPTFEDTTMARREQQTSGQPADRPVNLLSSIPSPIP